ncbi:hypothetical protein AOC36_04000 [Erysipelothrix larvae]|uniref:Prepilin-type N-terminal cleavage/methylation domain-containing protein n=1 Tax=Erysipelothrix larvae TaxID=1514105 RepID=A0A0X8GZ92_9FIRM|nr:prepilin-type N-terminal cleavage/methylation domain-containing protein [Erysipelothrix larvae]AMC93162.1 hypothetical protein AOC36_04000 [Erysipelothrix larvae]
MQDRKGFTLIELIIAMLISGIVLTILTTFVIYVLNIQRNQENFLIAQDAVRVAGLKIEKDIRTSSQSIKVSTESNCTTISENDFDVPIIYCLSQNTLTRNGDFVTNNIETFTITQRLSDAIDIYIKGVYEGRAIEYDQKIYLRTAS